MSMRAKRLLRTVCGMYVLLAASIDVAFISSILYVEFGLFTASIAFLPMLLLSYSDYSFAHLYFFNQCIAYFKANRLEDRPVRSIRSSLFLAGQILVVSQVFIVYAGALYYNLFLFALTLTPSIVGIIHAVLLLSVMSSSLTHLVNVGFKTVYFKSRVASILHMCAWGSQAVMGEVKYANAFFFVFAVVLSLRSLSTIVRGSLHHYMLFCKLFSFPALFFQPVVVVSLGILSCVSYAQLMDHVFSTLQSVYGQLCTLHKVGFSKIGCMIKRCNGQTLIAMVSFLGVLLRTYVSVLSASHSSPTSIRLKALYTFLVNDKRYHRLYSLSVVVPEKAKALTDDKTVKKKPKDKNVVNESQTDFVTQEMGNKSGLKESDQRLLSSCVA